MSEPSTKSGVMTTEAIWVDPQRLGGSPCVQGSRFSLAQLLAEMTDGTLQDIADNFDIDYNRLEAAWISLVNQLSLLKINSRYIMSDPDIRGGQNCLRGHRIPISLILMNLVHSTVSEEVDGYELEKEEVVGMLSDLAVLLRHDWSEGPPENLVKVKEGSR